MTDIFGGNARAMIFLIMNFWAGMIVLAPVGDKPVMAIVATVWFLFFIGLFARDLFIYLKEKKAGNGNE